MIFLRWKEQKNETLKKILQKLKITLDFLEKYWYNSRVTNGEIA